MEYTSAEQAMEEMMKDHVAKVGPEMPTEKEMATAAMEKRPTAAYGRKKQGAGGGFAIIE